MITYDEIEDAFDSKHLWPFVEKLQKYGGGENTSFKCKFCQGIFNGSYYRVKAHLLKLPGFGIKVCYGVTKADVVDMQKKIDEVELCLKRAMPKNVPLPSTSISISNTGSVSGALSHENLEGGKKRRGGKISALEKAFNVQVREQLDNEIARMFYSSGLPFNLAKNPYFKSAFTFAAKSNLVGYVPPSYNALRTKLLQREKSNIEMILASVRSQWNTKGVTVVSDGWTDPQRRPIINFMAVNESGPMFLKAVNYEGEYKDKHFIFQLMKEVIEEVRPTNVVQIITDNAPVCRAAGLLIEQAYPHIFWTPCVVHTLNLALRNICAAKNSDANGVVYEQCHWISDVVADGMMIKNFIMNHSMRLAMFNDFSKLKLLSVADTRFASMIVMLRRLKLVKSALQAMVVSDRWSCYREDDFQKARIVKDKLLADMWWDKVDYIIEFTEPIYNMIRIADTDATCLHLIYDTWDCMIMKVRVAIYRHEQRR